MLLEGKVAIITGAASGIGLACARRFCEEGARVVIADIDEKTGEASAAALRDDDYQCDFIHCDVSERLDVKNVVAATLDTFGRIDILVNNAGVTHGAEFLELEEADFDRVLAVNLKGAFLMGQRVARQMVAQVKNEDGGEPGTIINMSSVNDTFAIANQVPYCTSKGGLSQLTKVMSLALAPYGIRVNAIGPGSIATEMAMAVIAATPSGEDGILARTPLGRMGTPQEVASVATYLASNQSSYITGQTIYADGGRLGLNYTVPIKS